MYNTPNKRVLRRIFVILIITGVAIPSGVIIIKNTITHYTKRIHFGFTPKNVECVINDVFSEILQKEIATYAKTVLTQKSMTTANQKNFLSELNLKFPIVKNITWKFLASQTLQLTVYGTKPYYTINKKFVLGDQELLMPYDYFSDINTEKLPNITINPKNFKKSNKHTNYPPKLIKPTFSFIHKIPHDVLNSFSIIFHDPSNIELTPKQTVCPCKIVTNSSSFFDEKKMNSLNAIFNDLAKQKLITQKMLRSKTPVVAFDTRFKNRIIVKFFQPSLRGKVS